MSQEFIPGLRPATPKGDASPGWGPALRPEQLTGPRGEAPGWGTAIRGDVRKPGTSSLPPVPPRGQRPWSHLPLRPRTRSVPTAPPGAGGAAVSQGRSSVSRDTHLCTHRHTQMHGQAATAGSSLGCAPPRSTSSRQPPSGPLCCPPGLLPHRRGREPVVRGRGLHRSPREDGVGGQGSEPGSPDQSPRCSRKPAADWRPPC